MKKLLLIFALLYGFLSYSQAGPTLGVGLEALTLNKGTIDVEVLTKIIMKKQKELKNEALKRFMFKMFPETNYTSRYYVQNCLNILLNEKNPQVIEKEILELTTNYAIALGLTKALIELNDNNVFEATTALPTAPKTTPTEKATSDAKTAVDLKEKPTFDQRITDLRNTKYKSTRITNINDEITDVKSDLEKAITSEKYYKSKRLNKRLKRLNSRLFAIKMRNEINLAVVQEPVATSTNEITFGTKLDIVSLSLSENELIRKKGFFKNKIDFREEVNLGALNLDLQKVSVMTNKIDILIKPYIENYEIIKAFLSNSDSGDNAKNITEELNKIYLNQLTQNKDFIKTFDGYFNDKANVNSSQLIQSLNEAKFLKKLLTIKSKLKVLENINPAEIEKLKNEITTNVKFDDSYIQINKAKDFVNPLIEKYNEILDLGKELKIKELEVFSKITKKINTAEYYIKNSDNKSKSLISNIEKDINEKAILNQDIKKLENEKMLLLQKAPDTIVVSIDSLITSNKNAINLIDNRYTLDKIEEIKNAFNTINVNDNLIKLDEILDLKLKDAKELITSSSVFFNEFLEILIKDIKVLELNLNLSQLKSADKDKIVSVYVDLFEKLNHLKNNKNITLEDVNFLEKNILKRVYETKLIDVSGVDENYDKLITQIKFLAPLLKIKIITDKNLNFKYSKSFISLFEFIGNLNKLDEAETYTSIIDLLRENSEIILTDLPEGKFKEGYTIFINGMKKYTLINTSDDVKNEYVEIDIVSFLNDLQQYYERNNPSKFSLYLSVGLNQNLFFNEFTFPESSEKINSIGFASEKIGVKYKLLDFKKYRGYENVIKSDVYLNKRSPFVNEWYVMTYGSGLLYSLANTSTNQNFSFAHIGFGTGIRFYNALDVNLTIGLPFVKNENFGNNGFIGIGLDIPLGEYLEGLGNK